MSAPFPHNDQRGKTGGSSFSPYPPASQRVILACGVWLIGLVGISVGASASANLQQQIEEATAAHLQEVVGKEAKAHGWKGWRLDLATRLPSSAAKKAPCSGKVSVSGGSFAHKGRQELSAKCHSNPNWTIPIRTEMKVYLPVVTSKTVINRGDTINRSQIQLQENEITRNLRGFYHRLDQVAGMGAARRIRVNQILSPDLIDQPQLIKRGDKIKITAQRDGISASMPGEALEKGSKGDVIRVKNLSSGKTIEAKVVEAGVVTSTF